MEAASCRFSIRLNGLLCYTQRMKTGGHPYPELDKSVLSVGWVNEPDEPAYWHARTFDERWQAIEINRSVVYGYGENPPRFQRVLEIA